MKILVIEDETSIVQVIRLYLEQAGYTVLSASDGITGLELHAREQPDLVILDLNLPGLSAIICSNSAFPRVYPLSCSAGRQTRKMLDEPSKWELASLFASQLGRRPIGTPMNPSARRWNCETREHQKGFAPLSFTR